jgi:hypothetical protein
MSNQTKQPSLKELYKFRDRVKKEMLGEDDKEYRSELKFLLDRTNLKIREVREQQSKI